MKKVIRLTESDLTKLVKKIIKESEQSAQLSTITSELSSAGIPSLNMDEINSDVVPQNILNLLPKLDEKPDVDNEKKSSTLEQVKNAICNSDDTTLENEKKKLLEIIGNKLKRIGKSIKSFFQGKKQNKTMNEQAEIATVIFGVTAPLWIWVAIGAIVLFFVARAIIRKGDRGGYGCSGRESYGNMIKRINRP